MSGEILSVIFFLRLNAREHFRRENEADPTLSLPFPGEMKFANNTQLNVSHTDMSQWVRSDKCSSLALVALLPLRAQATMKLGRH